MIEYTAIFNDIIDITHHDYAGWDEKQGQDHPDIFLKEIERLVENNSMTPQKFTEHIGTILE